MKFEKEHGYSLDITEAVLSLFNEENEGNFKYDINEIDLTAFFTGFIMAFNLIYGSVTKKESDLIECINIQNRLVMQYLIVNGDVQEKNGGR